MGIMVFTIHRAINFRTPKGIGTFLSKNSSQGPKKGQKIASEARQADKEDILSCVDAEEKIVINNQYPKDTITIGRKLQTRTKLKLQELLKAHIDVFAWTTAHMTGVSRTIIVGGEIFNAEHRVNESKHVEPVKQKKRSLTLEKNEAIHTQACPKENHPLPATESKVESIHRHQFKCFLDAYKGYHQILIAKKDEENTAFYTRKGVFYYKRLPFRLKNTGATYQRLIDKVFSCQVGQNMEVNVNEIVIKCDSKEEMLADIKETLKRL
ncbi:hypothetical protein Tco_0742472 [Tanacetum coccineum]